MGSISGNKIKLFAGNSNEELAEKIAANLGLKIGDADVKTFSDGEIAVNINESVRNVDVYIVQSTCAPVNNNLMELLIMIDAMKRASAGRITAVVPYYGYARQDRKAKARDPITAKLVANILEASGVDQILTMDLHANQIQGYFDIPVDHLLGGPILVKHFEAMNIPDLVVVSPDHGSVARARKFAEYLDAPIAIVDKRRPKNNESEVMNIIGDVRDKNLIILDDMIDTAGTLCNAAEALKAYGAKNIYACCTHPVLSGQAIEKIRNSSLNEVIVLDTIPLSEDKKIEKIKVLSTAELFSSAITKIFKGDSVSELFEP